MHELIYGHYHGNLLRNQMHRPSFYNWSSEICPCTRDYKVSHYFVSLSYCTTHISKFCCV